MVNFSLTLLFQTRIPASYIKTWSVVILSSKQMYILHPGALLPSWSIANCDVLMDGTALCLCAKCHLAFFMLYCGLLCFPHPMWSSSHCCVLYTCTSLTQCGLAHTVVLRRPCGFRNDCEFQFHVTCISFEFKPMFSWSPQLDHDHLNQRVFLVWAFCFSYIFCNLGFLLERWSSSIPL